jgi:hypothetical protein
MDQIRDATDYVITCAFGALNTRREAAPARVCLFTHLDFASAL